jgi:hypothetical protein
MSMRVQPTFKRAAASAALAITLALAATTAAYADLLVVSSDLAALKAGTQLADNDRLDLPAGVKVRVLLPSGKTQMLNGPISGFVRDITKGERLVEAIWSKARELFETGGVDQSKVGAVRSMAPPKAVASAFAWDVIPATASGSVCLLQGTAIGLERAAGDNSKELTIVDVASNAKFVVKFADGARQTAWPQDVALKPDASYQLVPSNGRLRQITVRIVDRASTEEAAAFQALLARDCRAQTKAWLAR